LKLRQQLVVQHPDIPHYVTALATTTARLGDYYIAAGRLADAEASLREALQLSLTLIEKHDPEIVVLTDLREIKSTLDEFLTRLGRPEESEAICADVAGRMERRVAALEGDRPQLAITTAEQLADLASARLRLRRWGDCLEPIDRAVTLCRATFSSAPDRVAPVLARLDIQRADVLAALGRHAEAEAAYRKVVEYHQKRAVDQPDNRGNREDLDSIARKSGRSGEQPATAGRISW
jgi:tetratricopeptide (TPR) repeat protein